MTVTKPAVWSTLPISTLLAHPGNALPQADAELTADVAANGVLDPLHVVTTSTGVQQVMDGLRRLAAAQAAGLESVPVSPRPVIRLTDLTAHPDNPREALDLSTEFVATFAAEGCRIPIKYRELADGTRQIVDGHRRFYAAEAAGLTHVPYELDELDDASTYLDMVITANHRTALTEREQAAALFSAAEAGAQVKRMATAAGTTQKAVRATLRTLGSDTARRAGAAAPRLNLVTLAALADLEARSAEAAAQVAAKLEERPNLNVDWMLRQANTELDRTDKVAAHRAELEERGARLRSEYELGPKAYQLRDIKGSTSEHETCQGHIWVLKDDRDQYIPYCSNVELFGHALQADAKPKSDPTERRRVIAGNKEWDAADDQRREWLAGFLKRQPNRATADHMATITALAMIMSGHEALADRVNGGRTNQKLAELVGGTEETVRADVAKRWGNAKNAARLSFVLIASAYEGYIRRTAWRDNGEHTVMQRIAAQWITWLVELGYEPSPIEAAVRDGKTYQPAQD